MYERFFKNKITPIGVVIINIGIRTQPRCFTKYSIPVIADIFDVVINMFSSFGYMEEDKDNFLVLKQIFEGLKRGGRVVLDLQNREWVIANSDFNKNWDQNESGMIFLEERIFDLNKSRAIVKFKVIESKKSEPIEIFHSIRLYTLTEIGNMLKKSGFKIASVYGSYDGNKYVGNWKDGMFHGKGTLSQSDGTKTFGEWKNGDMWNSILYNKDENIFIKYVNGRMIKP